MSELQMNKEAIENFLRECNIQATASEREALLSAESMQWLRFCIKRLREIDVHDNLSASQILSCVEANLAMRNFLFSILLRSGGSLVDIRRFLDCEAQGDPTMICEFSTMFRTRLEARFPLGLEDIYARVIDDLALIHWIVEGNLSPLEECNKLATLPLPFAEQLLLSAATIDVLSANSLLARIYSVLLLSVGSTASHCFAELAKLFRDYPSWVSAVFNIHSIPRFIN